MATFADLIRETIGDNPGTCGHKLGGVQMIAPGDGTPEDDADWQYALGLMGPGDWTGGAFCTDCYYGAPSWVAKQQATDTRRAAQRVVAADDAAARLADWRAEGDTVYQCPVCDDPFSAEEAVPVRVCTAESCQTETFEAEVGMRNCTGCNRPFSRKVTLLGHEGCGDSYDEDAGDPDLYTLAPTSA